MSGVVLTWIKMDIFTAYHQCVLCDMSGFKDVGRLQSDLTLLQCLDGGNILEVVKDVTPHGS